MLPMILNGTARSHESPLRFPTVRPPSDFGTTPPKVLPWLIGIDNGVNPTKIEFHGILACWKQQNYECLLDVFTTMVVENRINV